MGKNKKRQNRKNYKSTPKLNIGSWNVRTLLPDTRTAATRPERRTALVARELDRLNIDIAALSETRLADEGQLEEVGGGYSFFWKGVDEGEDRFAGVGFAVRTKLVKQLEELPSGINKRIIKMRLPLEHGRFVTIISVYAPTLKSEDAEKAAFYDELRRVLSVTPLHDKIWLCGDFNARVGTDSDTWGALGKHGVGNMNDNGLMLLRLCTEFNLIVGNTLFQQADKYKVTWMHPRSKHWHMLDYIIVRKRDRQDLRLVRTCRSAECWTDHRLVRAKFRLTLRRKQRMNNVKVPRRLNAKLLHDPKVQADFQNALSCLEGVTDWETLRDTLYRVGKDILGFVHNKHQDWFDENDGEISELLSKKRQAESQLLVENLSPEESLRRKNVVKSLKSRIQKRLRQMENLWWDNKSDEIERAANIGDTKKFHSLLREVHGPRSATISPLKSQDGSTVIKDSKGILNRWKEHFDQLLNRPSIVNRSFLDHIEQREIKWALDEIPSFKEVSEAIDMLNLGKAPDMHGIAAEMLKFGGENVRKAIWEVICVFWQRESVHQDWRDAILIVLFKNKGKRDECGNYRGIALLCIAGKVLSRVMLSRLTTHISSSVLPESQCGFRSGRGTADMIFSARQLQEKAREQRVGLYQVFIDLTKAFDTVNRGALWEILQKMGCPIKFVTILKSFHDDMRVRVSASGELSDPISVENGVKQGDIPAPTLFAIYFYVVFLIAFQDDDAPAVYIRYRTTNKLFALKRFNGKLSLIIAAIRDLLYADDCDLVSHTEADMQTMMDLFSSACTYLGLTISLDKTKVMFTPAPGCEYIEPNIFVYGQRLGVVLSFVYLGSTIHQSGSLDSEVTYRISKASASFGTLRVRCWSRRGISNETKVKVYNSVVLPSLIYALESCTLYSKQVHKLEHFQQCCLREIFHIRWQSLVTNEEVLLRSGCYSIVAILNKARLRWAGHVVRMSDIRMPKQLLYGELCIGNRAHGGQLLRFKDTLRQTLKKCDMFDNWEDVAKDRANWRKLLYIKIAEFEKKRADYAGLKRAVRKGEHHHLIASIDTLTCEVCSRVVLTVQGLRMHMKKHIRAQLRSQYQVQNASLALHDVMLCGCRKCDRNRKLFENRAPIVHRCLICGRVCKSRGGLLLHKKTHAGKGDSRQVVALNSHDVMRCSCQNCTRSRNLLDNNAIRLHSCEICGRVCKSKGGLTLHRKVHNK